MKTLTTERPGSNWRKILPGGTVRYKNRTFCHRLLKPRVGAYVAIRTESYWGAKPEASFSGFPCRNPIELAELIVPKAHR